MFRKSMRLPDGSYFTIRTAHWHEAFFVHEPCPSPSIGSFFAPHLGSFAFEIISASRGLCIVCRGCGYEVPEAYDADFFNYVERIDRMWWQIEGAFDSWQGASPSEMADAKETLEYLMGLLFDLLNDVFPERVPRARAAKRATKKRLARKPSNS